MDENKLISMVLNTIERVEALERDVFTRAEKDRMFSILDVLASRTKKFEEEQTLLSFNVSELKEDVRNLKDDMVKVKGVLKIV